MAKAPKPEAVLIEFTSDRLRILAPFITARAVDLATRRVIFKEKFFKGTACVVEDSAETIKVALLVAYELNPHEDFQVEEEAIIRGINADTLRERKKGAAYRPL